MSTVASRIRLAAAVLLVHGMPSCSSPMDVPAPADDLGAYLGDWILVSWNGSPPHDYRELHLSPTGSFIVSTYASEGRELLWTDTSRYVVDRGQVFVIRKLDCPVTRALLRLENGTLTYWLARASYINVFGGRSCDEVLVAYHRKAEQR